MPATVHTIEIARTPDDVFAYSVDVERRREWQSTVQEIKAENGEPMHIGSRARETRRVTGGPRSFTWEITSYDPPRSWGFRGTDGPVRPHGTMRFTPIAGGARTKVEFEIGFHGRGAGVIFALLAKRDSRKQVPRELDQLRQRLESAV